MPEANNRRFEDLVVGDTASFDADITKNLIDEFAQLSGDRSPIHMSDAFAVDEEFRGRIAHGFLGASFFSQLIGMHLPGRYALYLSGRFSGGCLRRP